MAINFLRTEITLVVLLVNFHSSSALIDLTQCISYRYVPCEGGIVENVKTSIGKNEDVIKFNATDCISYQFIPCRDGWESLTMVYDNALTDERLTSCEANEKLQNATEELAKILTGKNYCEINLNDCQNRKSFYETNLTNCENEKIKTDLMLGNEKNKFQQMNSTLHEKIFNCSTEKHNLRYKFLGCQSKESNCEERYNKVVKEKKFLSAYMASVWTGRNLEVEADMTKPIRDRMMDYIRYSAARLGLVELKPPNITSLKPEYGPVYNDILSFRYPITMDVNNESLSDQSMTYTSLFVAVTSLATDNNQKRRDEIRKQFQKEIKDLKGAKDNKLTWIKFGFFLGKTEDAQIQSQIEEESQKNGDVIQIDMIDSVGNSSLKIAAIFNWVRQNCANVNIFFKVNENYGKIKLTTITSHFSGREDQSRNLIYGVAPIRVDNEYTVFQDGKRRISEEEFPWALFPKYFNGTAYYITGNLIVPLLAAFQTMPMIALDDVYLGLCSIKVNIKGYSYCGSDANNICF